MIKNMGPINLVLAMLISAAYDAARAFRFLRTGRQGLLRMLLKGYTDTLRNMKRLLGQRRAVQRQRSLSDREIKAYFFSVLSSARNYRNLLKNQ
ncbi:MAG: hypothetical protein GY849_22365 [Deltaproteobacteria bacterium]|nr:hypothetical protein [Deltaproteobacteria bacterium]